MEKSVERLWRDNARKVWTQLEAEYELPYPVPPAVRAEVDADLEEDLRDATEPELPEHLEDYQGLLEPRIRAIGRYLDAYRLRPSEVVSHVKGRRSQVREPRRTRADSEFHRQRRGRVLRFVGESAIPTLQALRGKDLTPPRRIPWKRVMGGWRAANPAEKDLTPDALKRMFRLALADPEVCQQYVAATRRAWLASHRLMAELAPLLAKLSGAPEHLQSLARDLKETAEGLRAIADGRPRGDALAKNLRSVAREVITAARRLELKARR